jgi:hypothetical protein
VSAIDDLRRRTQSVAEHKRLHPDKDVYVSMEDAEALLREIDELKSETESLVWYDRYRQIKKDSEARIDDLRRELGRAEKNAHDWHELYCRANEQPTIIGEVDFPRHIGAEIEDGNDLPSACIQGVKETSEWSDDVIAVTPEQLVRIVKEAGKT